MIQQWEYRAVEVPYEWNQDKMNDFGREGWEFVTYGPSNMTVIQPTGHAIPYCRLVFKRKLEHVAITSE